MEEASSAEATGRAGLRGISGACVDGARQPSADIWCSSVLGKGADRDEDGAELIKCRYCRCGKNENAIIRCDLLRSIDVLGRMVGHAGQF